MAKSRTSLPVIRFVPDFPLETTNHFEIFAHGAEFDVDAYCKSSKMRFDKTWHVGEKNYRSNGVLKSLGDGTCLSVEQQVRTALKTCIKHQAELRRLSSFHGVSAAILGLQHLKELTSNQITMTLSTPSELTRVAQNIGFTVVHYVSIGNLPHRSYRAVGANWADPVSHSIPREKWPLSRAIQIRRQFHGLAYMATVLLRNHSGKTAQVQDLSNILTCINRLMIGSPSKYRTMLAAACDLVISHPQIFKSLTDRIVTI
jgi:hypothetical protein